MTKKNDIFKRKKVKEEDFITALNNISKKLIYKFKFGYHEAEDMKQQAAIFAIEGLENYDNKRPLENFLWTHVHNRLFNFKRDNYFRPDSCIPPSKKDKINKNDIKKKIMSPLSMDFETAQFATKNTILDTISDNEIIQHIDKNISVKYRASYLKLKGGIKLTKSELLQLRQHISELIRDYHE